MLLVLLSMSCSWRMVIYLDDMLFLHRKTEELVKIRLTVLDLLENLGFLINYELHPTRRITLLGFVIDSETMDSAFPQRRSIRPFKRPGRYSNRARPQPESSLT